MSRQLAVGIVFVAIVGSGALAGLWSGRWGRSQPVQKAVVRLEALPHSLGTNWDVQTDQMSERHFAVAELDAALYRHYVHRRTGVKVSVLLVCGRPGPISVHTPEACYGGAGFVPVGGPQPHEGPADFPYQFDVQDFRQSNVATPTLLRVFLTWGHEGNWTCPHRPRLAFATRRYLYKLYVVRQMLRPEEPLARDPAVELIKELMPQLQETLFPGA